MNPAICKITSLKDNNKIKKSSAVTCTTCRLEHFFLDFKIWTPNVVLMLFVLLYLYILENSGKSALLWLSLSSYLYQYLQLSFYSYPKVSYIKYTSLPKIVKIYPNRSDPLKFLLNYISIEGAVREQRAQDSVCHWVMPKWPSDKRAGHSLLGEWVPKVVS